jgi:hypothetical protein
VAQLLALIWDNTPKYIKWPVMTAFFLFLVPLKIRDEAIGLIHKEVHAVILPMKEKRDMEITQMRDDIATIKQDTRDIRNHLLGIRR